MVGGYHQTCNTLLAYRLKLVNSVLLWLAIDIGQTDPPRNSTHTMGKKISKVRDKRYKPGVAQQELTIRFMKKMKNTYKDCQACYSGHVVGSQNTWRTQTKIRPL